jgi:4-carboxymuconolactone decarboxylase
VCDATYARALAQFGEQGIVELLAIAGYYSMLALILNVARTPLPAGKEPQLPPFPA